ncbi:MAG: ATP-dependent DNA ligase [Euzebyales bacterium]|nr:ATP-dependent DNA ligase [Euzebyales bacterium]MDQ3343978.1 non-homologous end-joining DNA ligase [Actinomycetota bacterium]
MNLSHPGKVLWPQPGYSKADLGAYYERMADRLLPGLRDRPLTLLRANNGIDGERFIQKNLPASAPATLGRHQVWTETSARTVTYAVAATAEDLSWFANQNVVELHPWFSRVDRPDLPDLLAFDLDPSGPQPTVAQAAHWLREVLDELGLPALVKTSGKRGLHLYLRVQRRYSFSALRGFALAVSRRCADLHPDELTVEMRKADRGDRLLLDWSRAGQAQTLAAPWSPRVHPAGTVSTPLHWDEVRDDLDPTDFTLTTAPDRADHWAELGPPQRLERAVATLTRAGYAPQDRSPRARTTKPAQ